VLRGAQGELNKHIAHILSLLEDAGFESVEAIRKALKSAQSDLDMLEFRLQRSEKIKRTTAIFLDESVTELEEKRDAVEQVNKALEQSLEELKATQQQLVQQEKMASLGALTAGIAHEIKNPLNFVNNFAEVGSELVEELREAIAFGKSEDASSLLTEISENATQIAKHGKRADSIVKSMMQHARGGESEWEEVDINAFLEEYANLAWHGMRARDHGFQAEVIREFSDDVGMVRVMQQELGRVLLNLINNSFDALKEQGDAQLTISTAQTASGIEIRLSDNGPGIPEDIRDRVFEPFFTTKATGEGTGLGLSLSYDIITKGHRGTMTVGTGPEGGAEFVITLPA